MDLLQRLVLSLKWRGSLFDYLRGQFSEVVILGVAVEYEDMFRAGWSEVGDYLDLAHVAALPTSQRTGSEALYGW